MNLLDTNHKEVKTRVLLGFPVMLHELKTQPICAL
jgi:hypothetical protein